jgi:hypothetical protein
MCCVTHPYRDQLDRAIAERQGALPAFEALLAPSDDWRCRCALTADPCRRKATGEDLNCDWCRQTDHAAWARANLPVSLGGGADVRRPGRLYSPGEAWPSSADWDMRYQDELQRWDALPGGARAAYSGDFYQTGRVGGLLSGFEVPAAPFEAVTLPFEFNYDHLRRGLAQAMAADLPPATPAETARLFGHPKL